MNIKRFRAAEKEALRRLAAQDDTYSQAELDDEIADIIGEWDADNAAHIEMFGEPEDTYCIESGRDNCDDWGTGEGQFHGRM